MTKGQETRVGTRRPSRSAGGFTLLEAMLSIVLLALVAAGISTPYVSGFRALEAEADRILMDSRLRSRMEVLMGTGFEMLGNGSEGVTVRGKTYTINWSVDPIDLDGDAVAEPNAKAITVSVAGSPNRSLSTIVVDHEGRVGKI